MSGGQTVCAAALNNLCVISRSNFGAKASPYQLPLCEIDVGRDPKSGQESWPLAVNSMRAKVADLRSGDITRHHAERCVLVLEGVIKSESEKCLFCFRNGHIEQR